MAHIAFFLKYKNSPKSQIRAVVSFMGKQYHVHIGVSVVTRYWNASTYRCRAVRDYGDAAHVNQRLDVWRELLDGVAKSFEVKLFAPDNAEFQRAVALNLRIRAGYADGEKSPYLLDFCQKYMESCGKSKAVTSGYALAIRHLVAYEKARRVRVKFAHINIELYNSLRSFLNSETMIRKNGEVVYYAKNTIGKIVKKLLELINEARRAGYHSIVPEGFTVSLEESDNIYLTVDELLRLHRLNITERLVLDELPDDYDAKRLEEKVQFLIDSKDVFLVGAFTAMRFGDYGSLENVRSTDMLISKRTQKTGAKVVIPMHWVVREILERRGNKLPRMVNNKSINRALKELGKLARLDEPVEKTITRGGKKVTSVHKKYELIGSHTARRSGCTNMYLSGIDIYTIMGFSGHKTVSSFQKYIRIRQEENARRYAEHPFFVK